MVGDDYINGLSLCAGVGGLDLALELAFPGYRTIAAVENNPEAARRFRLRFPKAKVFRDVVGFDGRPLRDRVGAVAAGWPCQPHSVAGKRLGTADERWIWGDVARILAETDAPLFFGENVSGLLRDTDSPADPGQEELDGAAEELIGGMGTVLRDLAEMGRVTIWGLLRAASVGASHGRPRIFLISVKPGVLLEHASDAQWRSGIGRAQTGIGTGGIGWRGSSGASASVGQAHAPSRGLRIDRGAPGQPGHAEQRDEGLAGVIQDDASGCDGGLHAGQRTDRIGASVPGRSNGNVADPGDRLIPLPRRRPQGRNGAGSAGEVLADAEREPGSAKHFADPGERSDCGALDGSVLGHPRVGQADACEPGPSAQ